MQALQQEFGLSLEDFVLPYPIRIFQLVIWRTLSWLLVIPSAIPNFLGWSFDCKLQEVNTHYKISPAIQSLLPDCSSSPGSFAILHSTNCKGNDSQLKFPTSTKTGVFWWTRRTGSQAAGRSRGVMVVGTSCLTEKGEG